MFMGVIDYVFYKVFSYIGYPISFHSTVEYFQLRSAVNRCSSCRQDCLNFNEASIEIYATIEISLPSSPYQFRFLSAVIVQTGC